MSVRLLSTRLVKHGRFLLQTYWKRDIHTNIFEQNQTRTTRQQRLPSVAGAARKRWAPKNAFSALGRTIGSSTGIGQLASSVPRSSGIFRFGQQARKLFIDNILNRVTTTYSAELRSQATKKLFYGDSGPFFALIGVSLASGAGVLTKEDELEGVCWEIREAANRLQNSWNYDKITETLDSSFSIDKLDIGPAIAKGCAAIVYAAALKNPSFCNEITMPTVDDSPTSSTFPEATLLLDRRQTQQQQSLRLELMSPLQNMSRFVHNFGGSLDNLQMFSQTSAATHFEQALKAKGQKDDVVEERDFKLSSHSANISLAGSGVSELRILDNGANPCIRRFPLALKMMFNYDIQSNAMAILRAMYKETVPARQRYINEAAESWEQHIQDQTLILPAHPNIVCMYGFFCDEVGNFPDGHLLYPIAQPPRINPNGYGRNMSLYLLMKRYDYSLREFLDSHLLTSRSKLILLTQLLEAVAHISRHGIAHRDLKSDNILIERNDDDSPPILVLSDFGCCLADKVHGLQVPYTSYDSDKGGNAALMAPEIINKTPGPFAVLNYNKADLWACGTIAYEIFGLQNPFYSSSGGLNVPKGKNTFSLRNSDYKAEDLPPLSDDCPTLVQQLIYNILLSNPSKRVSPEIAANIMQLFLWAPSQWLKVGGMPNSPEILQWLLSLTTKLICESKTGVTNNVSEASNFNYQQTGRRTYVEYLLISSFLSRARLRCIRGALNWIQNMV